MQEPKWNDKSERNPYADIRGVPYPVQPLRAEESEAWGKGMREIFERMKNEERQIIENLQEALRTATQEEFEQYRKLARESIGHLGGKTVNVAGEFEGTSPTGIQYTVLVMFRPRTNITQKDEPPAFAFAIQEHPTHSGL